MLTFSKWEDGFLEEGMRFEDEIPAAKRLIREGFLEVNAARAFTNGSEVGELARI